MKQCVKCEYFEIAADFMKGVDFGRAACKKHTLTAYFTKKKQLEGLTCIEEE